MGDPTRGIYEKFTIRRTDGSDETGGRHDGCNYFVLDITHDEHALPALLAYADSCQDTYPLLAADIRSEVRERLDDTPDHFEGNLGANIAGGRFPAALPVPEQRK